MPTKSTTRKPPPSAADKAKSAWKKKSDSGPHKATLPSGMEVTFTIPNSTALIRADMLPDRLAEIAIMAASYPDGAEGYMADLGIQAMREGDEGAKKLKEALKDGLELRDWLLSQMLVDPALTPAEVASGEYPQADLDMLIAFAERRRNTDAKGVKLPITVLEELAPFPTKPDGSPDPDALEEGGDAALDVPRGDDAQ